MGLDNYAVWGKKHDKYIDNPDVSNVMPNELFPTNRLVGGMFSGGGNSFRGKVYNDFVEFFTGYSLYEDELDNEQVTEIYKSLLNVTEERFIHEYHMPGSNTWDITYAEVQDLTKWFGVVSDEGGSVISWY